MEGCPKYLFCMMLGATTRLDIPMLCRARPSEPGWWVRVKGLLTTLCSAACVLGGGYAAVFSIAHLSSAKAGRREARETDVKKQPYHLYDTVVERTAVL